MKLPSKLTRKRENGSAATRSATPTAPATTEHELTVDLERRRDQLVARVAELQWDLGGLVYEMAVRNQIEVEVLVKRAVALQDADAELSEVERIVRMEQTGTAAPARPAALPTAPVPPSAGSAGSRCSSRSPATRSLRR